MRAVYDGDTLPVQALYSVARLARFAHVTRHLLVRVLRSNGVVFVRGGRALFVPLSEIERKIPPLFDSIRRTDAIHTERRAAAQAAERPGRPGSSRYKKP
ncbi:MAG TPA: hypothetical protein VGG39_27980 [Polyangiaceae bacterium]|jgi:hypothetical protein